MQFFLFSLVVDQFCERLFRKEKEGEENIEKY